MEAQGSSCSRSHSKAPLPPPSDPDQTAGRAASLLANLPSRGLFSSSRVLSSSGGIRVYVCEHDTAPPEEQLIKTKSTDISIGSLQINKQKSDAEDAASKAAKESNKDKRLIQQRMSSLRM